MSAPSTSTSIVMGISVLMVVLGMIFRRRYLHIITTQNNSKWNKLKEKLCGVSVIAGAWMFVVQLLPLLFGSVESEPFVVEISPERHMLYGFSISDTAITTWIAMGALLLLALIIRIFVVPRMKQIPRGIQNVLETAIDGIDNYTNSKAHGLGQNLSAYLFSIALLLISCAMVELFRVRAPTADITMTIALAFITFILINYYGIREKGVVGRVKSLANPTPVVLILRVISDCAIPVSMACRLFGNMLGGMIVMDLLYSALGNSAVGIPSVLGLYFNVFHPLIQAFIFITLTLAFISEATE